MRVSGFKVLLIASLAQPVLVKRKIWRKYLNRVRFVVVLTVKNPSSRLSVTEGVHPKSLEVRNNIWGGRPCCLQPFEAFDVGCIRQPTLHHVAVSARPNLLLGFAILRNNSHHSKKLLVSLQAQPATLIFSTNLCQ